MIAATPARRPASGRRVAARPGPKAAAKGKRSPATRTIGRPGPTVIMGVLWAALLGAATEAGQLATAVVVVPVAVIAAVSTVRAVAPARAGASPAVPAAVTAAVVLPLAALGGLTVAVVIGVLIAAGAAAVLAMNSRRGFPYAGLVAALAPAVAAASVVAARGQGLSEGLTLIAAVCLYDMASFLTGTSPQGGPAGVIVGMITVGVLAVFVSAVVVPPFSGRNPWILLGLVAVLAPAGVLGAGRLASKARLPALRRLDSLILAGPAWVIGVALLLHR